MSFFAFLRALRSRIHGPAGKRARPRRKDRAGRRPHHAAAAIERLEERTLMAVLPPAVVTDHRELNPPPLNLTQPVPAMSSPAVAINPLDPNKAVLVYSDGGNLPRNNPIDVLTVQYTLDGGRTWLFGDVVSPQLNPLSPFDNPALHPRVSKPSVTFDRENNFYVAYTEHAADFASGALVVQGYRFNGNFPVQTIDTNNIYRWAGQDAAFNPTIVADTTVPFFKDPVTGRVQVNPAGGRAIYLAWNTLVGPIGSAQTTGVVNLAVSTDRGRTFSGGAIVNDFFDYDPPPNRTFFTHDTAPSIVVSQGTADGRVPGGQVTLSWFNHTDFTISQFPSDQIWTDSFNFGGLPPVVQTFQSPGFQFINDPPANAVAVTEIPIEVNITDPSFDFLADLDVELALAHAGLDHILIELVAPIDPANPNQQDSVVLVRNRVDAAGNTIGGNNPVGLPATDGMGAFLQRNNGFVTNYRESLTVFDQEAVRSIRDTSVGNPQPYIGHFRPETFFGTGLDLFYGRRPSQLNGTWTLRITDFRNSPNGTAPPDQFISTARLRMASRIQGTTSTQSGFGQDQVVAFTSFESGNQKAHGSPLRDTGNYDYPLKSSYTNAAGIGPGPVLASDNTLGSFSPYQGRIYLAYTGVGRVALGDTRFAGLQRADNTDVFLLYSDDGGQTWTTRTDDFGFALPINDDVINITSEGDDFSEGNRAQFQPQLDVDPVSGTLAVSFADGRRDAARQRTVITLTTSIDGGATFSEQVPVNRPQTAVDTITGRTEILDYIPTNRAATTNPDGVGFQHGLAIYGGTILNVWAGNTNAPYSSIQTSVARIAAGPRIINATMGPVDGTGQITQGQVTGSYNNTTGPDGQRLLDGFVVTFDRPIDPATLTAADITVLYRSPTTPTSLPGDPIPAGQITVTAADNVGPNGQPVAITPRLTLGDASLIEGNSGTSQAVFTVYLSFPLVADLTINFATASGSATAGSDFTATTGSVTLRAGQTSTTISVPVLGDALQEGNETFTVTLTGAGAGAQVVRGTGTATIVDDDGSPSLSVGDVTVRETTGVDTSAVFQVFLSFASNQAVTVRYATAAGTAATPADFGSVSGTLTFLPGETIKTIAVPIVGDSLTESNEQFTLDLSETTGAVVDRRRGTGTIVDNDSAPVINVSVGDATVAEGNGPDATTATFTVYLDTPRAADLTVNYATADGTARAGVDYQAVAGTLTIPAGQTRATVTVNVLPNTVADGNRTFVLELSNPSAGLSVRRARGFGTVVDDDAQPTITVSDATVLEGNQGTTQAQFTVRLSSPSPIPVAVTYAVTPGTAAVVNDYQAVVGSAVTLAAGETTATIVVNVVGDLLPEDNEMFTVRITDVLGATLARTAAGLPADAGVGTIVDDDGPIPVVGITDAVALEGGSAAFNVYLSTTTTDTVTVSYSTASGLATDGTDYTASAGTITFLPGQISQTISVPIAADGSGNEGPEDFVVNVTGATFAAVGRRQAAGRILDDGANIYVSDATIQESAGTATFTVFLDFPVPVGSTVGVDYVTQNDTARDGVDYTFVNGRITFGPGQIRQTVTVPILANSAVQADRRFRLQLANPAGGTLVRPQGQGTILDDDGPVPVFSVSDAIAVEGDQAVFNVFLSRPSPIEQRVTYTTVNGSAVGGPDYDITGDVLVFAPGETSKEIRVTLTDDGIEETTEVFGLRLLPGTNTVPLAREQGVGTVVNRRVTQGVIGVSDAVVLEASGTGAVTLNFTVFASLFTGFVSVNFATVNGSAVAGQDYTAQTGTVNLFGGFGSTISIPVSTDNLEENNKTFRLQLRNAQGDVLDEAVGVILDNDVNITIADVANFEGDGGRTSFEFPIILDRPVPGRVDLALRVNTQNGLAVAGQDFLGITNGVVNQAVQAGQTRGLVSVEVIGDPVDPLPESNEDFAVVVDQPSTGTLRRGRGEARIIDDEVQAGVNIVSVGNATVQEGTANRPAQLLFPIFIDNRAAREVVISYSTQDITAVNGVDYVGTAVGATGTIRVAPNQSTATIPIEVLPNGQRQLDRTMRLILVGATGASIVAPPVGHEAEGLILDDDFTPNLSAGDVLVSEGDTGTVNATFTLLLSAASPLQAVNLNYDTADGTANQGSDYTRTTAPLTIPAGQTTRTVTVPVRGDSLTEALETFFVDFGSPNGATFIRPRVTGKILDDDDVQVSVGDATVAEGNLGDAAATFSFFLNRPSARPVTVTYATSDGSASAARGDYTALTGTVTFQPGETVKTVVVNARGDSEQENNNEFFLLTVTGVSGAGALRAAGVGTIIEDDGIPIIIADATLQEGDNGTKDFSFEVFLPFAAPAPVSVSYTTVEGSATAGDNDFVPVTGTLTIPAGATSATINVRVNGDVKVEGHETFRVRLTNPTLGTLVRSEGVGTILNDDTVSPAVSAGDIAVTEGGTVNVPVFLNFPVTQDVTIDYTTADGTARAGVDYAATSGRLVIRAGQLSGTIAVPTLGNSVLDGDRSFAVNLTAASGARLARPAARATVVDDDRLGLSVSDVTVREGDGGTTAVTFTVYINEASTTPVTFTWGTTGGTAAPGADYSTNIDIGTIPAGAASATFTVLVSGDTAAEPNETIVVTLRNPSGAGLVKATGTATVIDDDTTPAVVSVGDVSVREGSNGGTQAVFTVHLSSPAASDVTVDYTTQAGTATAGSDFTPVSGTLTIPAGQTSANVAVNVVGDTDVEGNEAFTLVLSNATGAALRRATGTATIIDDETRPFVSVGDVTVREGQSGATQAVVTVFLSSPAAQNVVVTYSTQDGTATAGADYAAATNGQVTILAGATSATFTLNVIGDTAQEGNEDFLVTLTGATNAVLRRAQAAVTIVDDETPLPSLSVSDLSAREGDTGTATAFFTIFLSNPHNRDVRVDYATADGTARAGLDYVAVSGTAVIPAGQTSITIPVTITGDRERDGLETFFLNLSNPIETVIARPQGGGVIADDDDRDAATTFLVRFTPQARVGTYSYAIGPNVLDTSRTGTVSLGANSVFTPTDTPLEIFGASNGIRTSRIVVPAQTPGVAVNNPTVTLYFTEKAFNFYTDNGFPRLNAAFRVTLIAPDGTRVPLFNQNQLSGQNLSGTTFSDAGAQLITAGQAPYTGVFRPVSPLSALNGKDPSGEWRLEVLNTDPNTLANIDNWYLDLGIGSPGTISSPGNPMDQDADGIRGEANQDAFAAPTPVGGTPFQLPYRAETLPLIVAGPHVIATSVPGQVDTADNLVLNATNDRIDVTFDRDMLVASFTPDQVLRIVGPVGPVSLAGVTVTPLDPRNTASGVVARVFRVTFARQTLSGTYTLALASTITSATGDRLDSNLNAGLDILRSDTAQQTVPRAPITFANGTAVAIPAGGTVESVITVTDPFQLLGLSLSLNILHQNVSDLIGELVSPTGAVVRLFTNVGRTGPQPRANFSDTRFEDTASTPIQLGFAPFNVGPFNPQFPLAGLNGQQSNGQWRLRITNGGTLTGTITRWTLTLQKPTPGSGLGELVADQATFSFRIFTQDQSNPQSHNTWTPIGPASQEGQSISSRVTGLAVDPSDTSGNTVFVAGASGGVWKTHNFLTNDPAGPTYVPLTDFGGINTINIGGLAVFPRNNDSRQSVVFAVTGEGDTGTPGVGLLRSLDGGASWELIDSARNVNANGERLQQSQRDRRFIGLTSFKVVADPTPRSDGNLTIYAVFSGRAADAGLWQSDDTGNTWTRLRAGQATDLVFAEGSAGTDGQLQILYAGFRGEGVFLSPNRGSSWLPMNGGQGSPLRRDVEFVVGSDFQLIPFQAPDRTPQGAKGRIVLAAPALVPGNALQNNLYQGWLYALVVTPTDTTDGLYLTKDFGRNWTRVRIPVAVVDNSTGYPSNDESRPDHDPLGNPQTGRGQGNYDVAMVIDPLNPNVVYIGGSGTGSRLPAGDVIRVDTTGIVDGHNMTAYNYADSAGGVERSTAGGVNLRRTDELPGVVLPPFFFVNTTPRLNVLRDPLNPFLADSTVLFQNVTQFNNDGSDIRGYAPFTEITAGSVDIHRMLSYRDPVTGLTRLVFGDDQGVFTGVADANGNIVRQIGNGATVLPTGPRNGNLQLSQMYFGAVQPSVLAAELAGALFYGSDQDTGFPASDPFLLSNGNLRWGGSAGDGAGAVADPGGSGSFYQYRWPCCGGGGTNFFQVDLPDGFVGNGIGRTNGLLQGGDNPGTDAGQWPELIRAFGNSFTAGNFAVNPINGNPQPTQGSGALVISAPRTGRIFRTTDGGRNWFVIAEPGDVGGEYAPALAFGAPETQASGNLDNFIYAGNVNGQVFVTFTGGGATPGTNAWKNISAGVRPAIVRQIVTNPKRGSHEAYMVTSNGVYHMADSSAANAQWDEVTGNLFDLTRPNPYDGGADVPWITEVATIQADWRAADADDSAPPVLYVGGRGGVFRSRDGGQSWEVFPNIASDGAPADGGYLPVVDVTELELSQGDINPTTGRPRDERIGLNLLVAFTYGRGAFVIRLDNTSVSGPAGSSGGLIAPGTTQIIPGVGPAGVTSAVVTFNGPVDPFTFTVADVVSLTGPGGAITPTAVVDITPIPPAGQTNLHNVYRIDFPAVTRDGVYTIVIGPNISDYAGNLMNQNGVLPNGQAGVAPAGDAFSFSFVINSSDNGRFLSGNYNDLLGRQADSGGFLGLLPTLDDPRYALLGPIATAFLFDSNPANPNGQRARAQLIRDIYSSSSSPASYTGIGDLLGAPASDAEVNFWLNFLRNGGRPQDIFLDLVSHERYFAQNRPGHAINGDYTAYITQAFRDLFFRDPTQSELDRFVGDLSLASLQARRQITGSLVVTRDYLDRVVREDYQKVFNRDPDTGGLNFWVAALATRRLTEEQLLATLYGSPEYFERHTATLQIAGPGTNETYIKAVHLEAFGVLATPSEVQFWLGRLGSGTSRTQMALELFNTDRYRLTPQVGLIDRLYQRYLGRFAPDADRAFWNRALVAGLPSEALALELTASAEYVGLNKGTATSARDVSAAWIAAVYDDLFGRAPTTDETQANVNFIANAEAAGRQSFVRLLINAPEFLNGLAIRGYQLYLGRTPGQGEVDFWRPILGGPSAPNRLSPLESFLAGLFSSREYFERQTDTAGLHSSRGWLQSLNTTLKLGLDTATIDANLNSVLSAYQPQRLAITQQFLSSDEHLTKFITDEYQRLLGRPPARAPFDEVNFWITRFRVNGITREQLTADLLGSSTYFSRTAQLVGATGPSTNRTFIQAVYLELFETAATEAEIQFYLARLDQGQTREQAALELLRTDRYRFDPVNGLVNELYQDYLERDATAAEIAFWKGRYQAGLRTEQLIADLLASNNYFVLGHTFP